MKTKKDAISEIQERMLHNVGCPLLLLADTASRYILTPIHFYHAMEYCSIGGRRTGGGGGGGGLERSLDMFLFFVIPAVSFQFSRSS